MSTAARQLVEDFYASGGPVGDPDKFPDLFHRDYVSHTSPPGTPPGPGQAVGLRNWLTTTFSDVEYELVRLIAEDDVVATHTVFRATHSGHGLGLEPTGRRLEVEQMHLIRVADGRIAEHWGVRDDAGMMRQIGAAQAA
jgi:ketosteroid isomerase-like protein